MTQKNIIKEVILNYKTAQDGEQEFKLEPKAMTIFVGANNSGKTLLLNELNIFITQNGEKRYDKILENIILQDKIITEENYEEIKSEIENTIQYQKANGIRDIYHKSHLKEKQEVQQGLFTGYLKFFTAYLGIGERIQLANDKDASDTTQKPKHSFHRLEKEKVKKQEIQNLFYEKFKEYIDITTHQAGRYFLYSAQEKFPENIDPHSEEFANFIQNKAIPFSEKSDGIRSFVGMLIEVLVGDSKVILIDEPEAFLHPPLAQALGRELSRFARENGKQIFVSTHSSHFLMGCLEANQDIDIIRLSYENNESSIKKLDADKLKEIVNTPLLRSTNLLQALFYKYAIIVEGDSDRCFYDEINYRLLQKNDDRGIEDCLFIEAKGKGAIKTIIPCLKAISIPTACIVDFDFLKSQHKDIQYLLKEFSDDYREDADNIRRLRDKINDNEDCDENHIIKLNKLRKFIEDNEINIEKISELIRKEEKKINNKVFSFYESIQDIPENYRDEAEDIIRCLKEIGIFVVSGGTLESWLLHLKVNVGKESKGKWLENIFDKMGKDPNDGNYIKPCDNDVWEFIGEIKKYFTKE